MPQMNDNPFHGGPDNWVTRRTFFAPLLEACFLDLDQRQRASSDQSKGQSTSSEIVPPLFSRGQSRGLRSVLQMHQLPFFLSRMPAIYSLVCPVSNKSGVGLSGRFELRAFLKLGWNAAGSKGPHWRPGIAGTNSSR